MRRSHERFAEWLQSQLSQLCSLSRQNERAACPPLAGFAPCGERSSFPGQAEWGFDRFKSHSPALEGVPFHSQCERAACRRGTGSSFARYVEENSFPGQMKEAWIFGLACQHSRRSLPLMCRTQLDFKEWKSCLWDWFNTMQGRALCQSSWLWFGIFFVTSIGYAVFP